MNSAADLWLYNGKLGAEVCVQDRGLAYGDGLFETLLLAQSACPFATWHWRRLFEGCLRLGIDLPEPRIADEFRLFLDTLSAQQLPRGVVKLIVTRGGGGKGYRAGNSPANTLWQFREMPEAAVEAREGIALSVVGVRLAAQPLLAGLKHLNRLENVLAAQRAQEGFEPLLLDQQGNVIETLSHNIFAVFDGVVCTPKLDECGVAGVLRQWLIDQSAALGLAVMEQILPLQKLLQADEIFIGNSVRGFWPVKEVDGRSFDVGGVCQLLQRHHLKFLSNFPHA